MARGGVSQQEEHKKNKGEKEGEKEKMREHESLLEIKGMLFRSVSGIGALASVASSLSSSPAGGAAA